MFKKSKLLFVMPLAVSALMATPVYAEESNVQIPITVEGTERATVTIDSDNKDALSAVKGDTTITVDKNGAFTISYDEPADFKYTITQTAGDAKNAKGEKINYDTAAYTAHVFIEAKDDGSLEPHVIVWQTSQDSKSASVNFKNTVEKKKSTGADTSDNSNIVYECAALAGAVFLGIVVIALRTRAKKTK